MVINWNEFLQQGLLGLVLLIVVGFVLGAANRFGSMFADRLRRLAARILSKLMGDIPSNTDGDHVTTKDLWQLFAAMLMLVFVLPLLAEWFGSLGTRLPHLGIYFLYSMFALLGIARWAFRLGKRLTGWREHLQEALLLTMFIMMIDVALDHRDLYREARSSMPAQVSEQTD